MIYYTNGRWGLALLCQLRGSAAPKALAWALPSAACAVLCHELRSYLGAAPGDFELGAGATMGVAGINSVIGFLLAFRTQQAYTRWWEGGTLLQTVRGEWFTAYSALLSFVNPDRSKPILTKVKTFEHLLLRLMSLLYCAALQQVSTSKLGIFEIINLDGMEMDRMVLLQSSTDRCEIILHWVQQLIMNAKREQTLVMEAPLLSTVFTQLARGIVNIDDARKIKDFPFPFAYAQMMTGILVIHCCMTPLLMSLLCEDWWWAAFLTLLNVFCFWGMNYVAMSLETPFGDGVNDLPLADMQRDFNHSLTSLLMKGSTSAPAFRFERRLHASVRVQDVNQEDFVCPEHLRASASILSLPSEKVLGVLTQVSLAVDPVDESFEGERLPELKKREIYGRSSRHWRRAKGGSSESVLTRGSLGSYASDDVEAAGGAEPSAAPVPLTHMVQMISAEDEAGISPQRLPELHMRKPGNGKRVHFPKRNGSDESVSSSGTTATQQTLGSTTTAATRPGGGGGYRSTSTSGEELGGPEGGPAGAAPAVQPAAAGGGAVGRLLGTLHECVSWREVSGKTLGDSPSRTPRSRTPRSRTPRSRTTSPERAVHFEGDGTHLV